MTESVFTRKLLRALRSHQTLKDAVIFKHADRWTAGVPDFSVTVNGCTTWCEVKVKPNVMTKLQEFFLKKLGPHAFLINADKDGKWVEVSDFAGHAWRDIFSNVVNQIAFRCANA